MVDPGRPYERPRLNENPLILRSAFVSAGLVQVVLHLVRDYDQVRMLGGDGGKDAENSLIVKYARISPSTLARVPQPLRVLLVQFGPMVTRALNGWIFACIFLNPVLYFGLARHRLWKWTYAFARTWFSDLPEGAGPTGLFHLSKLASQMLTAPLMLFLLWEVSNTVFATTVAQPPLKKEHPLTSEIKDARGVILHKSSDPNGSLLTGLKAKKEINKAFAFWELSMIADKFEARRKTIYNEVDRADGNTWSQICELALKEISGIADRVKAASAGPEFTQKLQEAEAQKQHHQHLIGYAPEEATGLKKIADRTAFDNADVFAKQKPNLMNYVNNFAKSIGNSPNAQDPVSPQAKKYLKWAADEALTPQQRQYLTSGYLQREASGYMGQFLMTPPGEPFHQTFARSIASIVLGSPTSNQANITHAASALAKLCVSSLKEDDYGQVQKDVAKIIRAFTSTIKDAERLVMEFKPSWTDVTFHEVTGRQIYDPWTLQAVEDPKSVEDFQARFIRTGRIARFTQEKKEFTQIMNALKGSLEEILLAFEEYAGALGLTRKDLREAKEAIQKPAPPQAPRVPQPAAPAFAPRPEMEQVRGENPRPRERRVR